MNGCRCSPAGDSNRSDTSVSGRLSGHGRIPPELRRGAAGRSRLVSAPRCNTVVRSRCGSVRFSIKDQASVASDMIVDNHDLDTLQFTGDRDWRSQNTRSVLGSLLRGEQRSLLCEPSAHPCLTEGSQLSAGGPICPAQESRLASYATASSSVSAPLRIEVLQDANTRPVSSFLRTTRGDPFGARQPPTSGVSRTQSSCPNHFCARSR